MIPRTTRLVALGLVAVAAAAAGAVVAEHVLLRQPPPLDEQAARAQAEASPRAASTIAAGGPPERETRPEALGQGSASICAMASTPVRKAPDEGSEQVTRALFGHQLLVEEHRGRWLRVEVVDQDYSGWVEARAVATVPESRLQRGRAVTVDGTRPLSASGAQVTTSGWPEELSVGSVVMMGESIQPGRAEVIGPNGAAAWLPTGHLGPSLGSPVSRANGARVVAVARAFLGAPYEWGGMTSEGIDCSGLVWISHFACGHAVPRDSGPQSCAGVDVPRASLQPGDCLFFAKRGNVDHVGVYVGDGQFIHATPPRVTVSDLAAPPYRQRFVRARRLTGTRDLAASSGPVLIVDPDRAEGNTGPERIAQALGDCAQVRCVHASYRDLSPERLEQTGAGAVVLAGQRTPWWTYTPEELQPVVAALQETDLPVLGICGGHQLLAIAFGGTVAPIAGPRQGTTYGACRRERGWVGITFEQEDPLFAGLGNTIRTWENHCEEVKVLPLGFVLLARGSNSPHQAMRHPSRPIWGVQFHPETDDGTGSGSEILVNFLRQAGVLASTS